MFTNLDVRGALAELINKIDNQNEAMKEYKEYKKFDTPLGFRKLTDAGVLDDYIAYMDKWDIILNGEVISTFKSDSDIEIPKPSDALKKFKDKFKFF